MHARIYFVIIVVSLVIACFKDDKLESLSHENDVLKNSLRAYSRAAGSNPKSFLFDPFCEYRLAAMLPASGKAHALNAKADPDAKASGQSTLEIRNELTRSRREAEAYLMMIDALKSEVNIRDEELHGLRDDIARYQSEIGLLLDSLTKKEQALEKVLAATGRQNSAELQKKVQELSRNLAIAEAEACYATAQRAEATAHRIMFAPTRKKESLLEALEVYKKAFSLGKKEAAQNISQLQKSLFPTLAAD